MHSVVPCGVLARSVQSYELSVILKFLTLGLVNLTLATGIKISEIAPVLLKFSKIVLFLMGNPDVVT